MLNKRVISIFIAIMIATALTGCGQREEPTSEEPTSETMQEVENKEIESEVVEEVETETHDEVADSGVLGDVSGATYTDDTTESEDIGYTEDDFSNSYSLTFPEGTEGFTDKWVFKNDETWSYNQTHFVAMNGEVMDFMWEGPTELGEQVASNEGTLFLAKNSNKYRIHAWSSSLDSLDGAIKYYDKETIVTVDALVSYNDGDYYELYDEETYDKVIFKITSVVNGIEYTGYAIYMDDYATMTTYQFNYLERSDIFDDTRALKVAESLDFWIDYTPK